MSTFHCTSTFVIPPDRSVFSGRVLFGEIKAGMSVLVPLSGSLSIGTDISEVALISSGEPDAVGLVVRCKDDAELEFLRSLDARDEELEIEYPRPLAPQRQSAQDAGSLLGALTSGRKFEKRSRIALPHLPTRLPRT